jgi:2-dehydropantoate 2-reductase
LIKIFKHAGFSPSITKLPDAWQKTHVAVALPVAKALYRYESNNYELSKSFKTLKNVVLGTRELFSILKSIDTQIAPKKLYFYYLPTIIIAAIWQLVMKTKIAEYAMAKHTVVGKEELEVLEKQFMSLNTKKIELKHYNSI